MNPVTEWWAAKAAWEAWMAATRVADPDRPSWSQIPEPERKAWAHVADAVIVEWEERMYDRQP